MTHKVICTIYITCRKILDDLSAADPTLQKSSGSDLMPSAALLQAQHLQAALQQVASSGGLASTSLLPGLLQGGTSTASGGDQLSSQLSVMLPAQQQVYYSIKLLWFYIYTLVDTAPICSITIYECIFRSSSITSITE